MDRSRRKKQCAVQAICGWEKLPAVRTWASAHVVNFGEEQKLGLCLLSRLLVNGIYAYRAAPNKLFNKFVVDCRVISHDETCLGE